MSELPALAVAGMARSPPMTAANATSHLIPPGNTSPTFPQIEIDVRWRLQPG
jgi:hypothetical protein